MSTGMNARRIRNVAKIVAVAIIDQYLRDGCAPARSPMLPRILDMTRPNVIATVGYELGGAVCPR